MIKAFKIILVAAFVFALFLTCLVGAAHLYLLTNQGSRFLLDTINTLYPGKISGSAIEANLLTQEVSLENAVLLGPDGKLVLKARHVYLRMNLPALLRYEVVFEVINAKGPEFVLELDKDGWLNIESAFVEKTPDVSPFNVYIRSLVCTDGTFEYRSRAGKPIVRLNGFELLMKSAFETDTSISLSVPKAAIALFIGDTKIDLGRGGASCSIFNDRISDIRIASRLGSSNASLTGSITDMAKKAQLLCDLEIDADMVDISNSMGLVPEDTGRIAGRISARHDYDNPELGFSLKYSGGTLLGLDIDRADLDCTMTDRVASIKRLSAGYASGTLDSTGVVDLRQAFPAGLFEGLKEEDAITYDLSITGTSLLITDIPGMPSDLKGRINPKIALKGSGVNPESIRIDTEFAADCRGVSAARFLKNDDLSFAGAMKYHRNLLDIRRLKTDFLGISASSQGNVNLATGALDGTITLYSSRVSDFFRRLDLDAAGSMQASLKVSGTLDRPLADITAHAASARISGVTLGSVDMKAFLGQDGRLAVDSCTVSNRSSSIQAKGGIQVFNRFPGFASGPVMELSADLNGVTPSDFFPGQDLAGSVNGRVSAAGPLSDISADIELTGSELSYAGIPVGDAELRAAISQGVLSLSRLEFTRKNSGLLITGDVFLFDGDRKRLNPDPDIHLTARGDTILLEDFTDKAKGTFSLNAAMEGSLFHPIGDAELKGRDLDLGFQRFSGFEAKIQADGGRFWIDPAILSIAPGENINANGWISTDGRYAVSLGTQGLSLENLDFLKGQATSGKLFLNASGEGSLSNPALAGRIAATSIMFDDRALDDMTFSFELQDQKVDVRGNWNFSLKARHDLSSGDFSTTVIFAETELNPYFIISGRPNFSGRLTGRIDAQGNTGSLKNIDLTADIASVDISHAGKVILEGRNLSGSCKHGVLLIPQSRFTFGEEGWFDLYGNGHLDSSLTLDAKGIIPVDVLGMFSEDLSDSSGLIRVSTRVTTQDRKARASGMLILEDIAYTIPYNGQRLHTINGKIRIDGEKILVEELTGRLDNGSFAMGGVITHKGFTPKSFEILAEAKALPVAIPDMMDLILDGEASLDSSGSRSLLKSDVIILDGTYYRDVNVNLLTGVIERIIPRPKSGTAQLLEKRWPFLKNLDLDVSIKRRGNMLVENNIAELSLNPDMRITGTAVNPVVTGRIAVTEGVVTFQNNDFTVSRGVVDFLNPYRTEMTVDIKGETKVRNWTIDLTIEGGMDNLELKLTSTPSEEPADILSLLLVGKTSRELTQGQAGVTVSPTAMAAEMLASTYGGRLKKATTLDILELEASEFSSTDAGENLKLTIGKELSRRMTLQYQVETRNTETIQRGIAEYKILENLIVNGYQGSDGIFGADIQLRYEFR